MKSQPSGLSSSRLDPLRAGGTLILGYVIWGVSPLFYKFLAFANPVEIVLHRAVWSAPILAGLLIITGRLDDALRLINNRRAIALLAVTALIIALNWWLFIWAVSAEKILEISLGYFINPLMNVAVGIFIAAERFGRLRALAIGLAVIGVGSQVIQYGQVPWISLSLAASFTIYGYFRKMMDLDGQIGLFWETSLIFIPSLIILLFWEFQDTGSFTCGQSEALLLIGTGAMTVAPLLLWIIGARGSSFAIIGTAQFIAPSIQFMIALLYGEAFTLSHALTFGLIWIGLAVFIFDLAWFEYQKSQKTR